MKKSQSNRVMKHLSFVLPMLRPLDVHLDHLQIPLNHIIYSKELGELTIYFIFDLQYTVIKFSLILEKFVMYYVRKILSPGFIFQSRLLSL